MKSSLAWALSGWLLVFALADATQAADGWQGLSISKHAGQQIWQQGCGPDIFACRPEPRWCQPEPVCVPSLCRPAASCCRPESVCAPALCRPEPWSCRPEPICCDPEPACRADQAPLRTKAAK
jgi:hypothetical protein